MRAWRTKVAFVGSSIVVIVLIVIVIFGRQDLPFSFLKEKYAQSPSSFISVNGMEVHYRDEGNLNDSIPIVLLHGTGASLHTFDAWVENLKESKRIIRMDLPAYGLTGPFPERNYAIVNYVSFLKSFLSEKGIKHCILGGNSLGGLIAWQFTLENPEVVVKLVLIDAAGYPASSHQVPLAYRLARIPILKNIFTFITPRSIIKASVETVYSDKEKITEALVDRYYELSLRSGNRQAFIDRMSFPIDDRKYQRIHEIQQPTLILWGENDLLIPVANANRFSQDLPNDTLVILSNAGHVPMEENPEESLKALVAFLSN